MPDFETKPELLFVSPYLPAQTGHGASMRSGAELEALSALFRIHLILLIPQGMTVDARSSGFVLAQTASIQVLQVPRFPSIVTSKAALVDLLSRTPRLAREYPIALANSVIAGLPVGQRIRQVHVFRLGLALLADAVARRLGLGPERIVVDMDDFESESAIRAFRLEAPRLGRVLSTALAFDIRKLQRFERWAANRYRCVTLCSDIDREKFLARNPGARVAVLPNAYRVPPATLPAWQGAKPTLLFVGSLNYMPNVDALEFFSSGIWAPHLARRGYRVVVAGREPGPRIRALCAQHGFELVANPPDIRPLYEDATLLVVPIRTGGGTRIKILEAFGFGRPVVSTSLGSEGIAVAHGVHLMLADEPIAFAQACQRVLDEPSLAAMLVVQGRALVETTYSLTMFRSRMADICGGVGGVGSRDS